MLEDVFTMNDFGFPLRKPNHPRYLNTEFVGHTFPTKTTDDDERQREHTLRHARIHNQLASDPQYAGGIGWCAFDYNTHCQLRRRRPHLLSRRHRHLPRAQARRRLLQIAVRPRGRNRARARLPLGAQRRVRSASPRLSSAPTAITSSSIVPRQAPTRQCLEPSSPNSIPTAQEFEHLKYAPFILDREQDRPRENRPFWGDLRIDGYINGKQVISQIALRQAESIAKFALAAR